MKSLVVGYGNVGKLLAAELHTLNDQVTLARHQASETTDGLENVQVDLLDPASVDQVVAGQDIVYVTTGLVYKLSVWRVQWPVIIDNVIAAASRHKAKLVFVDNIYLYGPSPLQLPITEAHPRKPESQKGAIRLELVNKLESAMQEGLPVLIVRCADFYGPNVSTSGLNMAIDAALKGKKGYFIGNPSTRHSYSYVPDIARVTALLSKADDCFNQTWHVPAPPAITGTEMQKLIESALGKTVGWTVLRPSKMRLLGVVVPILRELHEMMYQSENDYVFDGSKFMARFPKFTVTQYAEGIAASVAAAREC